MYEYQLKGLNLTSNLVLLPERELKELKLLSLIDLRDLGISLASFVLEANPEE